MTIHKSQITIRRGLRFSNGRKYVTANMKLTTKGSRENYLAYCCRPAGRSPAGCLGARAKMPINSHQGEPPPLTATRKGSAVTAGSQRVGSRPGDLTHRIELGQVRSGSELGRDRNRSHYRYRKRLRHRLRSRFRSRTFRPAHGREDLHCECSPMSPSGAFHQAARSAGRYLILARA